MEMEQSLFTIVLFITITFCMPATDWISHRGCYSGFINDITKMIMYPLLLNQPGLCCQHCKSFDYFGLNNDTCYCFKKDVYDTLYPDKNCFIKCPGVDKIYCGSYGKVSVYERHTDFKYDGPGNCLAMSFVNARWKYENTKCDSVLNVRCKGSTYQGNFPFFEAKLTCENAGGRLFMINETFPVEDNHKYWVATFRTLDKIPDRGTTALLTKPTTLNLTTIPTTTTKSQSTDLTSLSSQRQRLISTEGKPVISTPQHDLTSDSLEWITTEPIESENHETINEQLEAMTREPNKKIFHCGLYCMVLTVLISIISILVLLVCLFQLRQQWYKISKKTQGSAGSRRTRTSESSMEEMKPEDRPVYLDPVTQKAVFHKRNTSIMRRVEQSQAIYDECELYSTTETSKRKSLKTHPGYHALNFKTGHTGEGQYSLKRLQSSPDTTNTDATENSVSNKNILIEKTTTKPNYAKPWDEKKDIDDDTCSDESQVTNRTTRYLINKLRNTGIFPARSSQQKTKPRDKSKTEDGKTTFTSPWSSDFDTQDGSEITESNRTARNILKRLKETGISPKKAPSRKYKTEAYEETEIDSKRFVYDKPSVTTELLRKKEPWKNYRYKPDSGQKTSVLTPGCGLSVIDNPILQRSPTFTKTPRNPPDLLHDVASPNEQTPSIDTNDSENSVKPKSKKKAMMHRLTRWSLRSTIFQKNKRPQSEAQVEHVYETPNPVGRSAGKTASLLVSSDTKRKKHGLFSLQGSSNDNNCSNYELAKPIREIEAKTIERKFSDKGTHEQSSNIYAVAQPISSTNAENTEKGKNPPIYFEPVI